MILSLPACLYIADAELANNLKKLTKCGKKKDHAHPGQLTYVHWINSIRDSQLMIRRHGLIPEPSNDSNLRDMFPPLSAIIDQFNASDKTVTKQACNNVVQFFFRSGKQRLLGAVSVRLLGKQSFYNDPTTILVYLKLFHAEVLRTLHPLHKDTAFLEGGLYHGCKVAQSHIRDSLYVKSGDMKNECRKVDAFSQFQLKSNDVYLNPQATAAHLLNTKSTQHDADNKLLKSLNKDVREWKRANIREHYIMMPHDVATDDDSQEKCRDEKAEKTTFTKRSFKEPMEGLSTALSKLRSTLDSRSKNSLLLNEVLVQYNVIANMTTHGERFEMSQQDTDDSSASSNDGKESDLSSVSSSHGSQSSESAASSDSDDTDSSESDDETPDNENIAHDNAAQQVNIAGEDDSQSSDSEDANSISNQAEGKIIAHDNTAQQVKVAVQGDNPTSNPEDSSSTSDQPEGCANSDFSLDNIVTHVASLKGHGVTLGRMAGKDIKTVLGLIAAPNLKRTDHKNYFCTIKSENMKEIKQLYKKTDDGLPQPEWIEELALYILSLKENEWSNSFVDLPEGAHKMDEDLLLLWKQDQCFDALFMTKSVHASPSQRRNSGTANSPS